MHTCVFFCCFIGCYIALYCRKIAYFSAYGRLSKSILNSKRARQVFLKHDTAAAKKILEAEDITPDSLKNVTYEMLANELSKRMFDITHVEVLKLKTDAEYEEKLNALRKVVETVQSIVLDEIDGN